MKSVCLRCLPVERVPFEDQRRWLRLWDGARRGGRRLPAWDRDLGFADFPPTDAPRMVLLQTAADIGDSFYRFWGSGLKRPFGEDLTGGCLRELSDAGFAEMAKTQYTHVSETAAPAFFLVRLWPHQVGESFEGRLRLPFGDDGTHVDMVLSMQFTEKDGFDIRTLWDEASAEDLPRQAIA